MIQTGPVCRICGNMIKPYDSGPGRTLFIPAHGKHDGRSLIMCPASGMPYRGAPA